MRILVLIQVTKQYTSYAELIETILLICKIKWFLIATKRFFLKRELKKILSNVSSKKQAMSSVVTDGSFPYGMIEKARWCR